MTLPSASAESMSEQSFQHAASTMVCSLIGLRGSFRSVVTGAMYKSRFRSTMTRKRLAEWESIWDNRISTISVVWVSFPVPTGRPECASISRTVRLSARSRMATVLEESAMVCEFRNSTRMPAPCARELGRGKARKRSRRAPARRIEPALRGVASGASRRG